MAVIIVSFTSFSLLKNCHKVWSFSTISLSSHSFQNQHVLFADTNDHDQKKITNKVENRDSGMNSKLPNRSTKNSSFSKTNKYKDRKEQQQRERERRGLQNKLHRARDSILYFGQDSAYRGGKSSSAELRSAILPDIVQSYTSAIIQSSLPASSSPESDLDAVQKLFDPWKSRRVFLAESRPVQERILGLLAVLIQIVTHIEEEYMIYTNECSVGGKEKQNKRTISSDTQMVVDHIRFVQSQLWKSSREILHDMAMITEIEEKKEEKDEIPKEPHVVSPIAITALAKALRESQMKSRLSPGTSAGTPNHSTGVEEIKELINLVNDAKKAASKHNQINNAEFENGSVGLDQALITAWNNYLSSLCDWAMETKNPSDAGLRIAATLVMQNDNDQIVESNVVSYNTVMSIAARVGNATIVDTMWQDLIAKRGDRKYDHLSLQPNSRTYNARLIVSSDKQRLEILDKEIIPAAFRLQRQSVNASVDIDSLSVIDSFSIDMVIMPLLKANRKKHLFQLIDHWMVLVHRQHDVLTRDQNQKQRKMNTNKAGRAFKNAMAAFFITLVQRNGDVRMAREIWNRYMVLNIDNSGESGDKNIHNNTEHDVFLRTTNIVYPERRHYNILLDGYARLVDQVRDRQARRLDRIPDTDRSSSNEKATRSSKIWEAAGEEKKKIWETLATNEGSREEDDNDAASTSEFYEDLQEKAIHDGQELFALMMAQQQQNSRNKVGPDAYTKSTMIRLCRSGSEVRNLLQRTSDATATAGTNRNTERTWLPRAVTRAAVITCGRLGDPSMACVIFDQFMFPDAGSNGRNHFSNYRAFNVLLGALAAGAKLENAILDVVTTTPTGDEPPLPSFLLSELHGLTCTEAIVRVLNLMTSKNSQTYCVAASGLQYAPVHERTRLSRVAAATAAAADGTTPAGEPPADSSPSLALQIFHNATRDGIRADGRLVNAIFRCYGDDIAGALDGWKTHIRRATYAFEASNTRTSTTGNGNKNKNKNMLAAYNGLLYVCGRAERPDIAVRIVYAMKNREGLDPSENPYNNYRNGKSTRKNLVTRDKEVSSWRGILPKIDMVGQYENILYVECKKYDTRDRRTEKEKRIRIIV